LGAGLDQSNGYYFYSPYNPVFENRPNEIRGVASLILEKSLFFTPLCETWANHVAAAGDGRAPEKKPPDLSPAAFCFQSAIKHRPSPILDQIPQ
jgi:hypothetical protein